MKIVKITNSKRTKRVPVKITIFDVDTIIAEATKKLNDSTDFSYRLVLEEDGTEMDDAEILEDMVNEAKAPNYLRLMLLETGTTWEKETEKEIEKEKEKTQPNSPALLQTERPVTTTQMADTTTLRSPSIPAALPIDEITPLGFKNSKNPPFMELELIRNVAAFMERVGMEKSSESAEKMARQIIQKYPEAFKVELEDVAGQKVVYSGLKSLKTRIFDRYRYRDRSKKTVPSVLNEDSTADDPLAVERCNNQQDSYGCVAYEPVLPSSESNESQELKKKKLLDDFTSQKMSTSEVEALMDQTYPTQRANINKRENLNMTTPDLLDNHWPYLKERDHFYNHASKLIGQNVEQVWKTERSKKTTMIVEFLERECQIRSAKKTCPHSFRQCLEELRKAKCAGEELGSEVPENVCLFPMLAEYFGEEKFFTIVDPTSSIEDIEKATDSSRPVLVVKGHSIYDETSKSFIVIEKKVIFEGNDFSEGVLVCFLCFYVFGYNYPVKSSATYEFIQRMFLKINPAAGNKRGKKKENPTLEPKSAKLIKAILKNNL